MYTVAVQREFIAQHSLIGGDWGAENQKHSHHYRLELQLEGETLDQHHYLVDIVEIEGHLEALTSRYRDQFLNNLPEFEGVNPSIEFFSRLLCQALADRILAPNIRLVRVKLWENEIAWAGYEIRR